MRQSIPYAIDHPPSRVDSRQTKRYPLPNPLTGWVDHIRIDHDMKELSYVFT